VLVKKRLGSAIGAVALSVALAPALAATPALATVPPPAGPPQARIELESVSDTHCLDEIASSNPGLGLTSCEGAPNQEWIMTELDNDITVRLQNASTGACLAERPGTGVIVTGCDLSSPEQTWSLSSIFTTAINGIAQVQFQASNGGYLNQTGFQVDVTGPTDGKPQDWVLTPATG
jgi:hypothetical protein